MSNRGWYLSGTLLLLTACGYKMVAWSSSTYATMAVLPIKTGDNARGFRTRFRDALIERCLAGSGLRPTDERGDLVLRTEILEYRENVIATATDGRTSRIQFTLRAGFDLTDAGGRNLWSLKNYQFSDQYDISTGQEEFRDEAAFVQDNAFRTIADLVITNITLAIAESEAKRE